MVSIITRAAGAARYALQTFRVWGSAVASVGTTGLTWFLGGGRAVRPRGDEYANGIVGSAAGWLWRNMLPLRVTVERPAVDGGKAILQNVAGHPLVAAIENGPYYDHSVLLHGTLISWLVAGNAYWAKVRSASGLVVGYLYLPHFLVEPKADRYNDGTKLVTYYEYQPPGGIKVELRPEDVVHFRAGIDPEDPKRGLSPLAGCLGSIATENEADVLTPALLKRAGIPGLIFSPKVGEARDPGPAKRTEFEDRWHRKTVGDAAGSPMFLPFPADVSVLGFSPDKLVLSDTRALAASRILAPIGIDPLVLGLPSPSRTYDNYDTALRAAMRNALLPIVQVWASQLTYQALHDFPASKPGDRVAWDTSAVSALQEDLAKVVDRALKLWQGDLVTRGEARLMVRMDVEESRDAVFYSDVVRGESVQLRAFREKLWRRSRERRESREGLSDADTD